MTDSIAIRLAGIGDLAEVEGMLREAGLETEGLSDWIGSFLLAETRDRTNREIVATAGLEQYGTIGLLRSLIIRKKAWTVEDGVALLQLLLAYSRHNGLDELYLLTESPSLFIHIGFTILSDSEIPPEVRASLHFRQHRKRAVSMRKIL